MAKSRIGSLKSQARKLESAIKKQEVKRAKKREIEQEQKKVVTLRKKLDGLRK